jgi:hypothetical protein
MLHGCNAIAGGDIDWARVAETLNADDALCCYLSPSSRSS